MINRFVMDGQWHAMIGLDPQYDHMKGTPMHDDYMRGYDSVKSEQPVSVTPPENNIL